MTKPTDFHEAVEERHEIRRGSDRSFGIVFGVVFGFLSLRAIWLGSWLGWVWTALTIGFFAIALAAPHLLAPLNRLWFQFGLFLGRFVNPVVMLAVFAVAVTPIAILRRALGHDPLRLKWDRAVQTYWIPRDPPGPPPESMKHQF